MKLQQGQIPTRRYIYECHRGVSCKGNPSCGLWNFDDHDPHMTCCGAQIVKITDLRAAPPPTIHAPQPQEVRRHQRIADDVVSIRANAERLGIKI